MNGIIQIENELPQEDSLTLPSDKVSEQVGASAGGVQVEVTASGGQKGEEAANVSEQVGASAEDSRQVGASADDSQQSEVTANVSEQVGASAKDSRQGEVAPFIHTEVMEEEYARHGCLSEESYSILEKVGISRHVANMYIEGQKAIAAAQAAEIMNVAGGERQYKAMTLWAAENLSDSEKEVFNNAVSGGDRELAKFAVGGLKARYLHAMGFEPLASVEGSSAPWQHGYESLAEMVRDVADPRYKNDEAYRRKVAAKAARSRF